MNELLSTLRDQRTRRTDACASDLEMDRLLAGNLEPRDATALRRRIAECRHCQSRMASLEAHRATFQAHAAPTGGAAKDVAPSADGRLWHKLDPRGWGALAAAAVAAVFFFTAPPERGTIRLKGADDFGYLVVAPGGRVRGDENSGRARPGDELQWRFRLAEDRHVAVLSRGDDGRISVYFPSGGTTERVEGGAARLLSTAVVLDGSAETEELFGVACSASVAVDILKAALASTPPVFPAQCEFHRRIVILEKAR